MLEDVALGVDIGTTGCKVTALNSNGDVLGSVMVPYEVRTPHPGWAEQDPNDWFNAFIQAIRKILRDLSIQPRSVKALGIDGMMNSPVFIDEELKPIRPCILWLDQRSYEQISIISKLFKEHGITSPLPITPVVALAKILWVISREPRTWEKTYKVVLPKDYVRLKLTGSLATDPSDASATLLFDGEKYSWAHYLKEIFMVDLDKLPEIKQSSEVVGFITKEVSSLLGLPEGIPVVTGCSDGAADALAAGLVNKYDTLIRLGTSGALFMVYDKYVPDVKQSYFILAHAIQNAWLIHQMFPFGIPHKWFFETFYRHEVEQAKMKNVDPYAYIEELIDVKEPDGLFFIPNAGYEEDPSYFYGAFIGIKHSHTRSHFALALLIGLAFSLREALEPIIEKFKPNVGAVKLIGGGSRSPLLQEIMAITLKSTIAVPEHHAASIGAGILAAVGTRMFASYREAIDKVIKIKRQVIPKIEEYERYDEMYRVYKYFKHKFFKHN